MYVFDQRLTAQAIEPDKAAKVPIISQKKNGHPPNVHISLQSACDWCQKQNITTLRAHHSGDERYCVHNVQQALHRGDISKASAHPQPQGNAFFPI